MLGIHDLILEDEELPVPEENEDLVDLRFIHWGYLNCCQTLLKGRKAKQEVWNTYWVTQCGTTLRFYLDAAIQPGSVFHPPPPSSFGPLPENEHKVAFFELNGAEVRMLNDGRVFRRKLRRSVYSKVYRQHLFQVKLHKINSYYAFQAPSQSALFTWVSKLQESIDAIESNEISFLAEERLQLAQYMMEKKLRREMEERRQTEQEDEAEESFDIIEDEEIVEVTEDLNPKRKKLKLELLEKRELLWQLETQIINFLGNKGDFKRREFTSRTRQDYYLVPTRMETFIPAGTNVTIFGQLPNRRWRCLIEMDELIKTMNILVKDLRPISSTENILESSTKTLTDLALGVSMGTNPVENRQNNLPNYPLIGSLPSSILELNFEEEFREPGTPNSDGDEPNFKEEEERMEDQVQSPYSSHKREHRKTPLKPLFDDDLQIIDLENEEDDTLLVEGVHTRPRDASSITQESNFEDVATSDNEEDSDLESLYDNVPREETKSFLRGAAGSGIIISKKLRQKGISIIVGSSSSEGEDDDDVSDNNGNAVYRKFHTSPSSRSDDWDGEQSNYIRSHKRKNLKQSFSLDQINGEFSTKTDLLRKFGQNSIHLRQDKDLAKAVLKLFDTEKGPDVKPPRNERRTLKLHKTEDEGFGFWLQTYGFSKHGGDIQKRTFVRYVEDEGSAYMAGLREGDIIVEVEDQLVEQMEHVKIVELITKAKTQLKLVVKFIDAVRRVELAVRLKKRQSKLKSKIDALEQLKLDEYNIMNGLPSSYDKIDSPTSREDGDDTSLHTSTESEISSIASSQSDELIVRTSKFAKRSSRVLDSIKELNCNENISSFSISDLNRVSTTTEDELLDLYCDKFDYHSSLPRPKMKHGLKRVESMPVQNYRSLPRKRMIDLDGSYAREYAIDYSNGGDSIDYVASDDSSDDCSSSQSSFGPSVQDLDRTPKRNRPKSYKLAINSLKHLEGDVDEV